MDGQYYLLRDGQQFGPLSRLELVHSVQQGQFAVSDMVWKEGMAEWTPVGTVLSTNAPALPSQAQPVLPQASLTSNHPSSNAGSPWLVIVSWIAIGLTCFLALIPAIGFLAWFISIPVLLGTLIFSIVLLSKKKVLQGVALLVTSLVVAPLFIGIAPIATTALFAAAVEPSSVGTDRSNFTNAEPSSDQSDQVSTSATSPTSQPSTKASSAKSSKPAIGDMVTFDDSVWQVISAREMGSRLGGGDFSEPKTTEGKFVYVRYKVTNNTNAEEQILFTPSITDSKGRTYEEMNELAFYLPEGETGLTLEQLPAGLPKTFSAIFEVPKDAQGLLFMTRSFAAFRAEQKGVTLGF